MCKPLALACCALLLVGACAAATPTYTLKLAVHEGQSWQFDQVFEGLQATDMSATGQPPMKGEQRVRQVRKGSLTVMAVRNGLVTAVRVAFDQGCESKVKMGGQEQTIPFPYAGSTVTITRDADGRVTNDFKGEADNNAAMELGSFLLADTGAYPKTAVTMEEQWEPDLTQAKQAYQLGPQDKAVGVCKLVAIITLNGRQAAEVITFLSVTKHAGDMELVNVLKGSVWYDLETGYVVQSSMDGTTTAKGTQQMPGPDGQNLLVTVNNSGQTQMRLQTKPLADGAVGAGSALAGPAPLALPPAAGGGTWAGTYQGDGLAVELTGANGKYSGSITKAGQKFPLTAEEAGGKLSGTFKSGADAFPFSATIAGTTMTLRTGQAAYTLQKQAPAAANPLDPGKPAAPANPLGRVEAPRAQPADGLPPPAELQQVTLPDPHLKCIAWTLVAPASWTMTGGVYWTGRIIPVAYNTELLVRAPAGVQEYHLFPLFIFLQTQEPMLAQGAEVLPVMDAATYIGKIMLPRFRPEAKDVKVLEVREVPKLAEQSLELSRDSGLPVDPRLKFQAARLHVSYTANGQRFEEMFFATVFAGPMPDGSVAWGADTSFSYRTEEGKLQAALPLLGTIAASLKASPQWVAARRQEMGRMVAAATPPPRVSSGTGTLSILDVSKSMSRDQDSFIKGLNASSAAQERIFDISRGNIPGTNTVVDPITGKELDVQNGYLHYYRDYYGVVHGSNLTATDFYTQYKLNTTELEPTGH